jgi:hypothetical protein
MAKAQKSAGAEQTSAGAKEGKTPRNVGADLGSTVPESFKDKAQDYPDGDPVLKATKKALTADSAQEEAKAKAEISKESPRASETPSGHALEEVASETNDTERGEKYARAKAARRWGHDQ